MDYKYEHKIRAKKIIEQRCDELNIASRIFHHTFYIGVCVLFGSSIGIIGSTKLNNMNIYGLKLFIYTSLTIILAFIVKPALIEIFTTLLNKKDSIYNLPNRILVHATSVIVFLGMVSFAYSIALSLVYFAPQNILQYLEFLPIALFWLLVCYVFTYLPKMIYRKVNSNKSKNKDVIYIYWAYFIKYLLYRRPLSIALGAVLLTLLTLLLFPIYEFSSSDSDIGTVVSFWSVYISAFLLVTTPLAYNYQNIGDAYQAYSDHIIEDNIMARFSNHYVFVGLSHLSDLIMKNVYYAIHKTPGEMELLKSGDTEEYELVIDEECKIGVISKYIVVVANKCVNRRMIKLFNISIEEQSLYEEKYENINYGISILLVPMRERVGPALEKVRASVSKVIIQTIDDPDLACELALLSISSVRVLSVSEKSTYDPITARLSLHKAYLVNPQKIEGRSIGQRVFSWMAKAAREGDNYSYLSIPKITISGDNKTVFYTLQNIYITLNRIGIKTDEVVQIMNEVINVIYEELDIEDEIISERDSNWGIWEFYPVRPPSSKHLTALSIPIRKSRLANLETYMQSVSDEDNSAGLYVTITDRKYKSVRMLSRQLIASKYKRIRYSSVDKSYYPTIIVSGNVGDKEYVSNMLDTYIQKYKAYKDIEGYPTQYAKDSRLTHQYIAANQISSVIRLAIDFKPVVEMTVCNNGGSEQLIDILLRLGGYLPEMESREYPTIIRLANYYSYTHRIHDETYVFSGTAIMEEMRDVKQYGVNGYYMHGDEAEILDKRDNESYVIMRGIKTNIEELLELQNRFESKDAFDSVCVHRVADCPITIMHSRKTVDNDIRNYLKTGLNMHTCEEGKPLGFAHIKIWAENDHKAGSIGVALSDVLRKQYKKNANAKKCYSIKYMTGETCINPGCERITLYAQEEDYTKHEQGTNIRAIKFKCDRNISLEQEDIWSQYAYTVLEHLNTSTRDKRKKYKDIPGGKGIGGKQIRKNEFIIVREDLIEKDNQQMAKFIEQL